MQKDELTFFSSNTSNQRATIVRDSATEGRIVFESNTDKPRSLQLLHAQGNEADLPFD